MSEARQVAAVLLERARGDLRAAQALSGDVDQDDHVVGFHAQQAIEKSIKAVLIGAEVSAPRTHDLFELLAQTDREGIEMPAELRNADFLTPWAVTFRYSALSSATLDRAAALRAGTIAILWASRNVAAPAYIHPQPLTVERLSPIDVEEILSWRYPAELSTYDFDGTERAAMLDPHNPYWAIRQEEKLVGYACLGAEARVPGLEAEEGVDDLGLGVRPDLVGQGLSRTLIPAVVGGLTARGVLIGHTLRAVILDWNLRSLAAVTAAGFNATGEVASAEGRFILMTRPSA